MYPTAEKHKRWNGGKTIGEKGRVAIYSPGHPRAFKRKTTEHVYKSILIAEKALGRPLSKKHPVHHVDEDPSNDSNDNLVICEDHKYHMLLHQRTRAMEACGHADWRPCLYCKEYDAPKNLVFYNRLQPRHRECGREYDRKLYKKNNNLKIKRRKKYNV